MRKRFNSVCIWLIAVLLLQWVPVPVEAAEPSPLYEDSFAGGLSNWDLFGSTSWQIQGSGAEAQLKGTTTSTSPQRAVVKQSSLPYSSKDYSLEFTAKGDRFRAMFRYTSGTSYYFLEFKNSKFVELWKYPNSSANVQVGIPVDIGAVVPGFNLTDWHQYQVEVKGAEYKLSVDGTLVTTFTDPTLMAGGIGFSMKSVGPAVNLNVDQVVVRPVAAPITFTIGHTPMTEIPFNTDLPVSFTLTDTGSPAKASIYFAYGDGVPVQVIQAAGNGSGYDNLSGVAQTSYHLDDGPLTTGTAVTVSGDGIHTLVYNSTDRAGNAETPKSAVIRIDSALPVIRVTGPLSVSRVTYGTLTIVAEDALSGVAETSYQLDGVPITNPYTIEPMSLATGVHKLSVEVVDAAGNRATEIVALTVTFTVEELDEMLNYGYDRGWIVGQGTLNSLMSKVQHIQIDAAKNKNNINFSPLLQEIQAQTGKKIDASFALSLQEDIAYLKKP
jgi:hypothetical protein